MRHGLVIVAALVFAGTVAAASASAPRFSFSAPSATPGDQVGVHVTGARREIRLYLVARADAPKVRSRLDARLSFIGAATGRDLQFTVPPLDSGSYVLAYWCRGCLPGGSASAFASRPCSMSMLRQ